MGLLVQVRTRSTPDNCHGNKIFRGYQSGSALVHPDDKKWGPALMSRRKTCHAPASQTGFFLKLITIITIVTHCTNTGNFAWTFCRCSAQQMYACGLPHMAHRLHAHFHHLLQTTRRIHPQQARQHKRGGQVGTLRAQHISIGCKKGHFSASLKIFKACARLHRCGAGSQYGHELPAAA